MSNPPDQEAVIQTRHILATHFRVNKTGGWYKCRISDALKTNRYDSAIDLEQTLMRYALTTPSCRNRPSRDRRQYRR